MATFHVDAEEILESCITNRLYEPMEDWLIENPDALAALRDYEPEAHQRARDIMGKNFHGIVEAEEHFGELTLEQWFALLFIPFSEKVLRECAETHVLVADVGISMVELKEKVGEGLFWDQDWYYDEEFALRTESVCWRLIRKTPALNSTEQSWEEQVARVDTSVDEIPSARQVVYAMLLHFLVSDERLFEACYVRTSDVDASGDRILVGRFGEHVFIMDDGDDAGFDGTPRYIFETSILPGTGERSSVTGYPVDSSGHRGHQNTLRSIFGNDDPGAASSRKAV